MPELREIKTLFGDDIPELKIGEHKISFWYKRDLENANILIHEEGEGVRIRIADEKGDLILSGVLFSEDIQAIGHAFNILRKVSS